MSTRLTETMLRQIIRETLALLESDSRLPGGYTNSQTHSMGWIDPEGTYHFDTDYPDHGEWAGMVGLIEDPDATAELAARLEEPEDSEMVYLIYDSPKSMEAGWEASKILLARGWAKVSNAYTIEIWRPTQRVLGKWLDLGMEADCDPAKEFRVFGERGSRLVAGSWMDVEEFLKELP